MNGLRCLSCQRIYSLDSPYWRCECGGMFDIEYQPHFDIDKITGRKPGIWRYREAIPVNDDTSIVTFGEGFTPLLEIKYCDRVVLIKQDHLFPSGSYKDRGSSVLISKIKELGITRVIEDSSGNAGASIAAYCARAGIDCDIFVPDCTLPEKVKQIKSYNANLHPVKGNREDAGRAALVEAQNAYYASHSWNPFFFQGTKTFAYEVCEQLGWRTPRAIVLPAGNGTLVLGAYIGFEDLLNAGIIDSLPKLIAVQAAQCAPLYRAFREGSDEIPRIAAQATIAEGIAIAAPVRGVQIIEAIRNTGGKFLIVSEAEILAALKEIYGRGFYIEPTAAATIAGLKKYLENTPGDELVVSVFTGHGLKSSGNHF